MTALQTIRSKLLIEILRILQRKKKGSGRKRGGPGFGDEFHCVTKDGCKIAGWSAADPHQRRGTLICLHGFGGSCVALSLPEKIKRLREDFPGLCAAAFDFRCHGRSGDFVPTLGIAETWDVSAVVTHLQENDFPAPFILHGESLGGMVAAAAAVFDKRIKAAICIMPPAAPLVAINTVPSVLRGRLINTVLAAYANVRNGEPYNVLLDGDLTWHDGSPAHSPRFLFLMGDRDPYGLPYTKKVWEHLYRGEQAEFNVNRSDAPQQKKWFRVAEDYGHDIAKWDSFNTVINDFLKRNFLRVSFAQFIFCSLSP